jgi:nitroimidazol reductase NimA-like FMN-containing flavoprotein (pyridoxamine 5'-phosphate oxidase superfamily)
MFGEMRRQDRQLNSTEAEQILQQGEYGVLSTTGANGYAYGVPLSYAYLNKNVYFHCAEEGQKLDNIRHNDRVSFCVVGKTALLPDKFSTRYESVIVFGRAGEVQGDEKNAALMALIDKYSGEFRDKGHRYIEKDGPITKVIKISIERMTGKARR